MLTAWNSIWSRRLANRLSSSVSGSYRSVTSNCLSGTMSLMRGHFLPREQYTPECRKGLGQDVSSADEIGIALVIAGDTSKHLSVAVAPIVLTTNRTCSGGAPRIDGNRQNTVLRRQTCCLTRRYVQGAAALRKFLPLVGDLPCFNPFKLTTGLRPTCSG